MANTKGSMYTRTIYCTFHYNVQLRVVCSNLTQSGNFGSFYSLALWSLLPSSSKIWLSHSIPVIILGFQNQFHIDAFAGDDQLRLIPANCLEPSNCLSVICVNLTLKWEINRCFQVLKNKVEFSGRDIWLGWSVW